MGAEAFVGGDADGAEREYAGGAVVGSDYDVEFKWLLSGEDSEEGEICGLGLSRLSASDFGCLFDIDWRAIGWCSDWCPLVHDAIYLLYAIFVCLGIGGIGRVISEEVGVLKY